jgi:hypothetical protein
LCRVFTVDVIVLVSVATSATFHAISLELFIFDPILVTYLVAVHNILHNLAIHFTLLIVLINFTHLAASTLHLRAKIAAPHIHAVTLPIAIATAQIATSSKICHSISEASSQFASLRSNNPIQ